MKPEFELILDTLALVQIYSTIDPRGSNLDFDMETFLPKDEDLLSQVNTIFRKYRSIDLIVFLSRMILEMSRKFDQAFPNEMPYLTRMALEVEKALDN